MKKKSLFKRVSGVLTGVFFSTSFILAANENGQLFGSETLIVVVALLLLFVPLFLYVRKLHSVYRMIARIGSSRKTPHLKV